MDAEKARAFLLKLPLVEETQQWGDNLVFWVGDKTLGGKMFCLFNLDGGPHGVASYLAGPERFHELVEHDGLKPAPYFGRIFWIAADRWSALRNTEWESELRNAYEMTRMKLTPKAQRALGLLPESATPKKPVKKSSKKAAKETPAQKAVTKKRKPL